MLLLCSSSSSINCGPSSTGLTIFFLSLSTGRFIDKEHWSLACYVLTITSILYVHSTLNILTIIILVFL